MKDKKTTKGPAPIPEMEEAKILFEEGVFNSQIAKILMVSTSTIDRMQKKYGWKRPKGFKSNLGKRKKEEPVISDVDIFSGYQFEAEKMVSIEEKYNLTPITVSEA